jgi:hypothetical protein
MTASTCPPRARTISRARCSARGKHRARRTRRRRTLRIGAGLTTIGSGLVGALRHRDALKVVALVALVVGIVLILRA